MCSFCWGISYNHTMEYFYTRGEVAQSLEFADWIPRLICSGGDVLQSWPCYILIVDAPPSSLHPPPFSLHPTPSSLLRRSEHLYDIILLSYYHSEPLSLSPSGLSLMSYIHLRLSNFTASTQPASQFMIGILSNRAGNDFTQHLLSLWRVVKDILHYKYSNCALSEVH